MYVIVCACVCVCIVNDQILKFDSPQNNHWIKILIQSSISVKMNICITCKFIVLILFNLRAIMIML